MNWFKMYAEFATDPKVQSMPEAMQRRLAMLFCFQCSGDLAKLGDEELAIAMRISLKELEQTKSLFIRKGFVDETWTPKNWEKRQRSTDPGAAERMRKMRAEQAERARNVARNTTVTSAERSRDSRARPEEETDTETEPPQPPEGEGVCVLDPAQQECIRIATERWGASSGDAIVGDFLRDYPAAWVRIAMDLEWDAHGKAIAPRYMRGILQRFQRQGGPDEPKAANGRQSREPPPKVPVKPKRPDLPRNAETEAIHAMWDRAEREDAERAAKLARQGVAG